MADVCIFCQQQKKMSNEHIFPQWLQKHLGVQKDVLYISRANSEQPQRTLVYGRHLNGKVCTECNSGWMSKIEGSVKPLLISMLDCVSPIHITADQSMILAWWVYKTALTLHSASPYGSVIPQRHYELALQQRAPADFMIAIAYRANTIQQLSWIQSQNWSGIDRIIPDRHDLRTQIEKTYRVTFGFRNFAARVHYFPLDYNLCEYDPQAIMYIHPGNANGFRWPLQTTIEDIDILDQSIVVVGNPDHHTKELDQFPEMPIPDQINCEDHKQ